MNKTTNMFSPDLRERAVRMVLDHEGQPGSRWAAIVSIFARIGCAVQTLNKWVKKIEAESSQRADLPTDMAERLKALEQVSRRLRRSKEILCKASACCAMAELDRRSK